MNANIAVHISQVHFEHPVRLLHPYLDYWHMKGPIAQKVAIASLQEKFSQVQTCDTSKDADVVLLLEPHVFYNAQMRVFHAEYIAKVYTNNGNKVNLEPNVLKIKKQAQVNGDLNYAADFQLEKAYTLAMTKIVNSLAENATFTKLLNPNPKNQAETICPALNELPISKLYY
jgi:hypothetical protein